MKPLYALCLMLLCSSTGLEAQVRLKYPRAGKSLAKEADQLIPKPLCGVNAYDLALIAGHIQAQTPFSHPFQLLAADINQNGMISTSDLVLLQSRLIGKTDRFPEAPTHSFYNARDFSDRDIYSDAGFSTLQYPPVIPQPGDQAYYQFVKIGDVDASCTHAFFYSDTIFYPPYTAMGFCEVDRPDLQAVAFFPMYQTASLAWQFTLRYNPEKHRLKNVHAGTFTEPGNKAFAWHESSPGELRIAYFNPEGQELNYEPGVPLFYLEFEGDTDPQVWLDTSSELESVCFDKTGKISRIQLLSTSMDFVREAIKKEVDHPIQRLQIYPNPTQGHFRIRIIAPEVCEGQLEIKKTDGKLIYQKTIQLKKGENILTSSSFPPLSEGRYTIHLHATFGEETAVLVKTKL